MSSLLNDDVPPKNIFGKTLLKNDGSTIETSKAFNNVDAVGLYFSAHWCPPCRGFTPKLSERYTKLKESGKKVEMVFLSSDHDQNAFNEYHKTMSFLASPFSNSRLKETLSEKYKVRGIPALIFIDGKTGKLITTEGRASISAPSFLEDFPYHPKPVNDISANLSGIQTEKSLIVMMESADDNVKIDVTTFLTEIATSEMKKTDPKSKVTKFFTAKGGGPASRIRMLLGFPNLETKAEDTLSDSDKIPKIAILDLAAGGKFYLPNVGEGSEVNFTKEFVQTFMDDFNNGKCEQKTVQS